MFNASHTKLKTRRLLERLGWLMASCDVESSVDLQPSVTMLSFAVIGGDDAEIGDDEEFRPAGDVVLELITCQTP